MFVLPPVFDATVVTLSVHVSAGAAAARGHGVAAYLSAVRRDMSGRAGAVHLMMQLHSLPASMADASFDKAFLVASEKAGLLNLAGHRSVGGMRASIYNAVEEKAVDTLIAFMANFAKENG